jgi:hypothetical protein
VKRKYFESNSIIGVIDSEIWLETVSFNDKVFNPPPTKWNGTSNTSDFSLQQVFSIL